LSHSVYFTNPYTHSLTVSEKNDTDVAHYSFDGDQPILIILAEILLREYAIKW